MYCVWLCSVRTLLLRLTVAFRFRLAAESCGYESTQKKEEILPRALGPMHGGANRVCGEHITCLELTGCLEFTKNCPVVFVAARTAQTIWIWCAFSISLPHIFSFGCLYFSSLDFFSLLLLFIVKRQAWNVNRWEVRWTVTRIPYFISVGWIKWNGFIYETVTVEQFGPLDLWTYFKWHRKLLWNTPWQFRTNIKLNN